MGMQKPGQRYVLPEPPEIAILTMMLWRVDVLGRKIGEPIFSVVFFD